MLSIPCLPIRYKQLEADGDEDDADLADQVNCILLQIHVLYSIVRLLTHHSAPRFSFCPKAADKDRAWDDWKDNNPRGWGNKMGKRF